MILGVVMEMLPLVFECRRSLYWLVLQSCMSTRPTVVIPAI